MPKIGHFPENRPKVGVPGGGFTSTPRAGALCPAGTRKRGFSRLPGRGGFSASWEAWDLGTPGPGRPPRDGDRAPPRGVDVKPPPRPGPGPVPEVSGAPGSGSLPRPRAGGIPGSRNPGIGDLGPSGVRRSRDRLPGSPRGPPAPHPGVDVKPLRRRGPKGPKTAKNPQNGGLPAKKAFFGHFGQIWPFLTFSQ